MTHITQTRTEKLVISSILFIIGFSICWALRAKKPEPITGGPNILPKHQSLHERVYGNTQEVTLDDKKSYRVIKDTTIVTYTYSTPTYSRSNNIINERALNKFIDKRVEETHENILTDEQEDYQYRERR